MDSINDLFFSVLDFILLIVPIVLPFFLLWALIKLWIAYARKEFLSKQEYFLIEIFPPSEVKKSPAAMELFLLNLYQKSGESTWIDRYWFGKVRAWFSLEIVAIDGSISFYIWGRKGFRTLVESQLYAQFPGIEIQDANDYTSGVHFPNEKIEIFGAEMALTQPDPYPIKTYVDYNLDKETEDEFKVDPISSLLEFLATLKQGNQIWIQIIVRAHVKEDKDPSKWLGKTDHWIDEAKDEIKKIREESLVDTEDKDGKKKVLNQTKGQAQRIEAIERSISKTGFDTGIRMLYLSKKDVFDPGIIPGMLGSFKQYNSVELNGFKPGYATNFDYPWQDITGNKIKKMKAEILEAYKDRDYFWKDLPSGKSRKPFILNTEELATIFHFSGNAIYAPGLKKTDSKKASPPANLPI